MVQPGAGVLLIADPFLKDPNFMRTVVFLTEHREDGTIGFVLNRQYENTLDELLPEVEGHQPREQDVAEHGERRRQVLVEVSVGDEGDDQRG